MNQDAFARALLRPDLPTPADIIAPAHGSATLWRFAVLIATMQIASLSDALDNCLSSPFAPSLGDTNVAILAACSLPRPSANHRPSMQQ